MNTEFQELKSLFEMNIEERPLIMQQMRKNLIARNGGNPNYEFGYIFHGRVVDISSIDRSEGLFEIEGDMCPQGL